MREWCLKEGCDYEKIGKYNQKKYILLELKPKTLESPPSHQEVLIVIDIPVSLSNGLVLCLHNWTIDDMARVAHRIVYDMISFTSKQICLLYTGAVDQNYYRLF